MDLRPTGSSLTVFEIRTAKIEIIVKCKKKPLQMLGSYESSLLVRGAQVDLLKVENPDDVLIATLGSGSNGFALESAPMFYEQCDYQLLVRGLTQEVVSFWHENTLIRQKIEVISEGINMLSGIINFDNQIGQSDFIFYIGDERHITLTLEVFPSKITYKEDYNNLLADVTDEVYDVIFDYLKKTYGTFGLSSRQSKTPIVFITILNRIFDQYIKAIDLVMRLPHHKISKEYLILPAHKIKHIDSRTVKWIQKHSHCVIYHEKGTIASQSGYFASKAQAQCKKVTYDTLENQFTKYMIASVVRRLQAFINRYETTQRNSDPLVLKDLNEKLGHLNRGLHQSFLKEVSAYKRTQSMSLVFSMAPGYRDVYKYYLMLLKGLTLNGDLFNISLKDTAVLYEYWCFIKLNAIMKQKYRLISPDIIKIEHSGISLSMVKGRRSELKYLNSKTLEEMTLIYNPGMINTQTVNQKPDNVLTLEKKGSDVRYQYVFDAKYRIDMAVEGTGYPDTQPGPKVEDINTMHRYRDAIVYKNNKPDRYMFEKTMFGAYVLFPYSNEESYREHHFYRSIETVNIGGLPFLPGSTQLVEEVLDNLISDSEVSAFERTSLPRGIEAKLKKTDWDERSVLVGSLRNKAQLEVNLTKRFYHIPATAISIDQLPIRTIALYQSNRTFGKDSGIRYYGTVLKTQLVKRKDIPIPMSTGNGEIDYYRFDVKSWNILDNIIQVKEEGVYHPKFTSEFLLINCETSYELFNIFNEEQYRLLVELKRFAKTVEVREKQNTTSFKTQSGDVIWVRDREMLICNNEGHIIERMPMSDFKKQPRLTFQRIKKILCIE